MTIDEVRALLRRACDKAGSQKAWCDIHGLAPTYIGQVLRGHNDPGPRVLAALGLTERTVYDWAEGGRDE